MVNVCQSVTWIITRYGMGLANGLWSREIMPVVESGLNVISPMTREAISMSLHGSSRVYIMGYPLAGKSGI